MHRTRIKICGITRAVDAIAAAHAGADAIGIVFHPAAGRYVPPNLAREILKNLPAFVQSVGLFVDADLSTIRQTLKQLPLSAIQLHGHESPQLVADLSPMPVVKAIRVDADISQTLEHWKRAIVDLELTNLSGIILETAASAPGGTGIANDWSKIRLLQNNGAFEGLPAIIAAGGLTPENVESVIAAIHPWAVDVSSGVEAVHREKSVEKIEAFISAVRAADARITARDGPS